jgi:hypothetical protein
MNLVRIETRKYQGKYYINIKGTLPCSPTTRFLRQYDHGEGVAHSLGWFLPLPSRRAHREMVTNVASANHNDRRSYSTDSIGAEFLAGRKGASNPGRCANRVQDLGLSPTAARQRACFSPLLYVYYSIVGERTGGREWQLLIDLLREQGGTDRPTSPTRMSLDG